MRGVGDGPLAGDDLATRRECHVLFKDLALVGLEQLLQLLLSLLGRLLVLGALRLDLLTPLCHVRARIADALLHRRLKFRDSRVTVRVNRAQLLGDGLLLLLQLPLHGLFDAGERQCARLLVDPRHDIEREVQDALQVARREVEQQADAARRALEVPDMAHRRGQLDVAHALAAHLRARDLYAALVADDAFMTHTLVFAARALPVLRWTKDALAEESVLLRLERAIVDSFWLGHLAIAPGANLLRAGQADADGVKIVDFEHWLRLKATQYQDARALLLSECRTQPNNATARVPLRDCPRRGGGAAGSESRVSRSPVLRPATAEENYSWLSIPLMLMPRSGSTSEPESSTKRISCSSSLSTSTLMPRLCSSLTSTLNDSGTPGSTMGSPLTMAS